ncbi:hypothetical protein BaRGS_00002741 [Batillaria attramentaria]|uniref:Uncharacterized protein n=1 Tax=Batillaria attramentaria TaxID=370345 RepID=A0ABD0M3S7_9CAEN
MYEITKEKSKLERKWKPYFRIVEELTPVTFRVRNQLDGTEQKTHAEHLRKVPIGDWNIPVMPATGKPVRKAQLAVPPGESSSDESENESERDLTPTERMTRFHRHERDGSSDEDDIPLMELQKTVTS